MGNTLAATTLPAGFRLVAGDERRPHANTGVLVYAPATSGDPPRLQLSAGSEPLSAYGGPGTQTFDVRGHPARTGGGPPSGSFVAVHWEETPGVTISLTGYKVSFDELLVVADGVRYFRGTRRLLTDADRRPFLSRDEVLARLREGVRGTVEHLDARAVFVADLQAHTTEVASHMGAPDDPAWVVWATGVDLQLAGNRGEVAGARGAFMIITEGGAGSASGQGPSVPAYMESLPDRSPRPRC